MFSPKISYAQNGEDIRVWRAFGGDDAPENLIYADIGANDPWELSITASLYELGWRGMLVEADPELAAKLRKSRPDDTVRELAAAAASGSVTFHQIANTGLGTISDRDANAARQRGFQVNEITVEAQPLDLVLTQEPHFMSIDVEGAESEVLAGLSFEKFRPWVLCIESIEPGTQTPNHGDWESHLLSNGYTFATFDGVNRWYVADERDPKGTLKSLIATPFSAVDRGLAGWQSINEVRANLESQRIDRTHAWQRELERASAQQRVPVREYEKQIHELRSALNLVEASKAFRLSKKLSTFGKRVIGKSRQVVRKLPQPISQHLTQRRHIKHATINMGHLTPSDFLQGTPQIQYIPQFTESDLKAAEQYLHESLRDSDPDLEARMDGLGDLLGRTRAATRTRMKLFTANKSHVTGNAILFDARSLQVNHFRNRGIGRFAVAALIAAQDQARSSNIKLVLLVDHGLPLLPEEFAQDHELIQRVTRENFSRFGTLIQPSPFTHSPRPLIPLLASDAAKLAIVFDFIPLHFPDIYLPNEADKVEYWANVDALRRYTNFVAISHLTKKELNKVLGSESPVAVAWPKELLSRRQSAGSGYGTGPIVVMTGDDPRKNTFGALAAIGAATTKQERREVVVLGLAGQQDRVHHWSIAAIMRPGEVTVLDQISDEQMHELLSTSKLVVVDSFDEGLSLPVLEALESGAKVIASDIPAHRELLGAGAHLIDPRSPKSGSKAIKHALAKGGQALRVKQEYQSLEACVSIFLTENYREDRFVDPEVSPKNEPDSKIKVALATPWPPQKSGVADYSAAIASELGKLVDLTIFSTGSTNRNVDELLENPDTDEFDVVISVVGNSHFHLPFIELTTLRDCMVISHDARMNEFYLALRGPSATRLLMESNGKKLNLHLDEQINDMRLLEDAAFWEIAHRSRPLVFHTPISSDLIGAQTGTFPRSMPFANYRAPNEQMPSPELRSLAKVKLGFDPKTIHLSTFGYVDKRTKQIDIILEAAIWLRSWGLPVALHVVGAASESMSRELYSRAQQVDFSEFDITGYIGEDEYRDYLLATDLAIQLRLSPYLGISGPVSDLAAYGTRAIVSQGLALDTDLPEFIEKIPNQISPLCLAETVSGLSESNQPYALREVQRAAYIKKSGPCNYARQLLSEIQNTSI